MEKERVYNERYRIDGRLGTGGMAIVYSGTDLLLRRRVAIKVLRDQYAGDGGFVQRFSYEAQAAAKLSHPNIVNVFDFGRDGDDYFIVMELMEGETLADVLRDERTIPEPVAIDYTTQIAAGLAYAHRQGLLHRDVKPANILVTPDDVVKLSDFGIARAVAENAAGVTQPGMVMGSVAYVSPEQAQGHELDERSDLYSLGVVLYQMISGRLPFNGETPVAVALKHVSEPAPRLEASTGASPALIAIVDRLLQKSPADRYASATELARALREAREQPAVAGAAAGRGFGDAPTMTLGRVSPPPPPPRPSSAPDRPASNGATAVVETPVAAAPPVRWLAFLVLLLVAIGIGYRFGGSFFGTNRNIAVDDFSGRSATVAQQQIVAAGLRPQVQLETSETVPVDRVIRQNPLPGSKLGRNDVLTLFVSSGAPLVAVPDVKGYTRADAEHALGEAKLHAKIVLRYDKAPKDTVVELKPAGGQQAPVNSSVTLVVSQGEAPVKVPQLVGLSVDAARALLAKDGLKLNVDQQTPNDLIPPNTVASQAYGVDTTLARGATVGVTISTGPMLTTVPDVGGKNANEAAAALNAAGYDPHVQYVIGAANASGTVIAEDPAAGTTLARRSPVTISVSVAGTVPDVGGMALDEAKRALVRNGYTVSDVDVTSDGVEGKVTRTDPAANAILRPGSAVKIYYHPAGGR